MVSPYGTHLTLECQRIGQYSNAIILPMDCHIYGRPELQFKNFTLGNITVELCQSDRILQQVWRFRSAVLLGACGGMMVIFGMQAT